MSMRLHPVVRVRRTTRRKPVGAPLIEAATERSERAILEGYPEFPYEFIPVRLGDIRTGREWVHFQRPVNERAVKTIINSYDPLLCDPLVLNVREDNIPYLIRGQHRRLALIELFGEDVLFRCRVYYGLSREEEALVFVAEDTLRRRIAPNDRWQAALDANLPPYPEIAAICERVGLKVDPNNSGAKNTIRAVGALVTAWKDAGGVTLARALWCLKHAGWTEDAPKAEVIGGFTRFLALYKDQLPSDTEIVKFLQRIGATTLVERAKARREVDRSNTVNSILRQLEVEWNHKRSAHRLVSRTHGDAP
jgi:hypothetical protein